MTVAIRPAAALNQIPADRWVRIIPVTIIVYIIAYMDRVNIGFAMAGGMNEALHLSLFASGMSAGIFFWGYLLLQWPGGHIAEHGSAKRFIEWSIVAWTVISLLTAWVRTGPELLVMRFLLGVAEGGVFPAILVLVGNWFPQRELGRANALFLISLPLSAAISSPVSGWIVAHYSWRGLFVFEGLASFALLFVWAPLICDRPEDAKWLSPEERDYLLRTLAAERVAKVAALADEGAATRAYARLLGDKHLWLMVAIYLCYSAATFGYLFWLPSIVKTGTGVNLTSVGWLSAVPLFASVAGVYGFGALSDRTGNRRLYCAIALASFGICFWATTLFPARVWVSYGLLVLAGLFLKAMQSPYWSLPSLLFSPGVSGGARGIINGIGNIGGFAGPVLVGWLARRSGNTQSGVTAICIVSVVAGVITMLLPRSTSGTAAPRSTAPK